MIYSLIDHAQQRADVTQACRVLQVSRAGYDAARKRAKAPAVCVASVQVKAAFVANQRCYGSRRLVVEMRARGVVMGRYKVRRFMCEG